MDHHQTIREIFDLILKNKMSTLDAESLELMLVFLDHEFERMDNAIIEVENDKERCQVQVLEGFCTRRPGVGIDEQRIKRTHLISLMAQPRGTAKPPKKLGSGWRRKRELRRKKEMLEVVHRICDKVVNVENLIHILHKKTQDRKA